ncbi:hypothetical protein QLX37_gp138 [Staphylococcus phage SA5]|uniref:PufC n=8 Tax=Kayvirus G1 TaxID=292029 RepID=I6WL54_9CAUD|nr:PufC cytochrome [Staphylococcus phage 812]YP_009780166.1 hypothetical protein QLX23_gp105 [Staphylococcus phage ISP]YP_009780409.1 hypothetical protein QLX37_gp138 [Staphylococcus phage SA5]YP_009780660.1 PufC [Staphylococcus phage Staph1N]YP_009781105.1 PufC [Staphylococcus phage 676Z]YP_009781338.1 PufC [Staphylococcus phage Fi200W]YP_009781571.1 PufC [Staphylococcus phage MSA6]YP_009781802.1 PufC [Staphylococcus phage P4W]YP_009782034.1 PufC [Staphylococcus phage A5W]ARM69020.1 hypot
MLFVIFILAVLFVLGFMNGWNSED